MNLVNENDKVVTKDFVKGFGDHRSIGLGTQAVTAFSTFNHLRRFARIGVHARCSLPVSQHIYVRGKLKTVRKQIPTERASLGIFGVVEV